MLSWRDFSSLLNKGLFVNASFPDLIILSNVRDQIPILSPKLIPFHSGAVGSVSVAGSARCPHPSRAENEEENQGDRFVTGFVLRLLHSPKFPVYVLVFEDPFLYLNLYFMGRFLM